MSEEIITSWRVLREDGNNCAWVNSQYVGVVSDEQVLHFQQVCPTPRALDVAPCGHTEDQMELMLEDGKFYCNVCGTQRQ